MDNFYPFIHDPKIKKKEDFKIIPLYLELDPPQIEEEKQENEEERFVIIEIL